MGMFDLFRRRKPGGTEAMRARLEGAMAKRRLRGWNPPLENINALVASGGPKLLARSRELVVTNGYAANACEAFAANLSRYAFYGDLDAALSGAGHDLGDLVARGRGREPSNLGDSSFWGDVSGHLFKPVCRPHFIHCH